MSYLRPLIRRLDERPNQRDEEVSTMAATMDVEFESGVYTEPVRRHQGYWAGDFSSEPPAVD